MQQEINDYKNSLTDTANFKYYTDDEIHKRINIILHRLQQIESNTGIDSTEEELCKSAKRKDLLYTGIKHIDLNFYERIMA